MARKPQGFTTRREVALAVEKLRELGLLRWQAIKMQRRAGQAIFWSLARLWDFNSLCPNGPRSEDVARKREKTLTQVRRLDSQVRKILKEALKHYNEKWITLKQLEEYLEKLKIDKEETKKFWLKALKAGIAEIGAETGENYEAYPVIWLKENNET